MLSFNTLFRFKIFMAVVLAVIFSTACSPLKEKLQAKSVVEMDYVDPELVKKNSDSPDHSVVGNLFYEIQKDYSTDRVTIFASATFHEPINKNVLFDKVRTNALAENEYKPKPVEQPCGIPGFPDCPKPVNPAPSPSPTPHPPSSPDEPCGIPGFPECPVKKEILSN